MTNISSQLERTLSATMRNALLNCYLAAQHNEEPYEAGSMKYAKGLIKRGLLEARQYISISGKPYTAIYLTQLAQNFMEYINEKDSVGVRK